MDPLHFILFVVRGLLGLLVWAIIVSAVLSWLVAFNILNVRHPFARSLVYALDAVTRPVLRPIQKIVPSLGGVDISPIIAILIIQGALIYLIPPA